MKNKMEQVMIKSLFRGWQKVDRQTAINLAKYKLKSITTGKDDEVRLEMINNRLKGIKFSLSDLK